MRECERVWKSVKECNRVWKSVNECERVQKSVKECEIVLKSVKECERVWKSVTECERVWKSVKVCETVWKSVKKCINKSNCVYRDWPERRETNREISPRPGESVRHGGDCFLGTAWEWSEGREGVRMADLGEGGRRGEAREMRFVIISCSHFFKYLVQRQTIIF